MIINLTKPTGVNLKTKGKLCTEDIQVLPALQTKNVTQNGTYTPESGYAGFNKIVVSVPEGVSKFDYQIGVGSSFTIGMNDYADATIKISDATVLSLTSESGADTAEFTGLKNGVVTVRIVTNDSDETELAIFYVNVIADFISGTGGTESKTITIDEANITKLSTTVGQLVISPSANKTISGVTINVALYNGETEAIG